MFGFELSEYKIRMDCVFVLQNIVLNLYPVTLESFTIYNLSYDY